MTRALVPLLICSLVDIQAATSALAVDIRTKPAPHGRFEIPDAVIFSG